MLNTLPFDSLAFADSPRDREPRTDLEPRTEDQGPLLPVQRLHRLEAGGFDRGVQAETEAHGAGGFDSRARGYSDRSNNNAEPINQQATRVKGLSRRSPPSPV